MRTIIHCRLIDELRGDTWHKTNKISTGFVDDNQRFSTKGGATFVINDIDGELSWGISRCSPSDNYDKKCGVRLSDGRSYVMLSPKSVYMPLKTIRLVSKKLAYDIIIKNIPQINIRITDYTEEEYYGSSTSNNR